MWVAEQFFTLRAYMRTFVENSALDVLKRDVQSRFQNLNHSYSEQNVLIWDFVSKFYYWVLILFNIIFFLKNPHGVKRVKILNIFLLIFQI